MTLTHHAVRLFRLSCGCLRAYPMTALNQLVTCARCRAGARTVAAYPARCCGARGQAPAGGRLLDVSCTRPAGGCRDGAHTDEVAGLPFTAARAGLARSREGKTGRA